MPAFTLRAGNDEIIARFPDAGEYKVEEGWLGLTVDLPPGMYALQDETAEPASDPATLSLAAPNAPRGQAVFVEEGWETLAALKREGKVAFIGVSNFDEAQLRRVQAIETPTSLQPPYSLLRRDIEERMLPYCKANNIGVIVYSPMQSGLLTGKMSRERLASLPDTDWRRGARYFQEPMLTRGLELAERLKKIAGKQDGPAKAGRHLNPGEVAIAWVLRNPAVTAAIVGARHPQQLDELAGAASLKLSEDDVLLLAKP